MVDSVPALQVVYHTATVTAETDYTTLVDYVMV